MKNSLPQSNIPARDAQSTIMYESLQNLSNGLAAHPEIQSKEPALSEYYSLFRESERLCRQIATLENKISHFK